VIGDGGVGLELSHAMRRLGSKVTIIESGPHLAGREDPDVSATVLDLFHDEAIEVFLGTELQRLEGSSGDKVTVHARQQSHEHALVATDMLVVAGRTTNAGGIGLELTVAELDARGYIKVDERLQTTAPNIRAMGDYAGSPQFTHVAQSDFQIVYSNLTGGNRTTRDRLVPFCRSPIPSWRASQ